MKSRSSIKRRGNEEEKEVKKGWGEESEDGEWRERDERGGEGEKED